MKKAILFSFALSLGAALAQSQVPGLLTDPILQKPTDSTVQVVWFTETQGQENYVLFGNDQRAQAKTQRLSQMAEDEISKVKDGSAEGRGYKSITSREIWRHEATLPINQGEKVKYRVVSMQGGKASQSAEYEATALPKVGQPLKIMLTSDHQMMPNTPANLQMFVKTLGMPDAVFMAGDMINVPDRASDWFDSQLGRSFFPGMQGNASSTITSKEGDKERKTTYVGAPILQNAPLYAVIGNHEVMGRARPSYNLNAQFNDPRPTSVAAAAYEANAKLYNPSNSPEIKAKWIRDNSYNITSYEEVLTLPEGPAGEKYYAQKFGDVFLIGLYVTRIWRTPSLDANARGKYREAEGDLNTPDNWGHGEFIFEDIAKGSAQYNWLQGVLDSPEFKNAKYKVVMMHQPVHGLGDNSNPGYVNPVQVIDRDASGKITAVRYEYPPSEDIFIRDVEPMLEKAGVNLVYSGHSHVWNRFQSKGGLKYLESSNVGNNYGCYLPDVAERSNGPKDPRYTRTPLGATGDPQGLTAIMPSIFAPMKDKNGKDIPCVASNNLSVFTVLDTAQGKVASYVYDMQRPDEAPKKFDEFALK